MDLTLSPSEEAFRDEVRSWLAANHPGEPPAVTVQDAKKYFSDTVDFYVDGGDLSGREPSTLIRMIDDAVDVIRQGAVKVKENGEIEQ